MNPHIFTYIAILADLTQLVKNCFQVVRQLLGALDVKLIFNSESRLLTPSLGFPEGFAVDNSEEGYERFAQHFAQKPPGEPWQRSTPREAL